MSVIIILNIEQADGDKGVNRGQKGDGEDKVCMLPVRTCFYRPVRGSRCQKSLSVSKIGHTLIDSSGSNKLLLNSGFTTDATVQVHPHLRSRVTYYRPMSNCSGAKYLL